MKILLDECLPFGFRHSFPQHEVHTVQWAGLKGKKNGDLLEAAEVAGYEVFITVDQGVPYQQNLGSRKLEIIIVRARTNQIEDLLPLVDHISKALKTIQPGQTATISTS